MTGSNRAKAVWEVFTTFLMLGFTSFGGPVAHLGYFHTAFVTRRKWLGEAAYADLVALCQFMPGPASSQVGIAIGQLRAGIAGAFAAWVAFTLPSAIALVIFAYGLGTFGDLPHGFLGGLKIAALAVVTQALWSMAQNLAPDLPRKLLAAASAILMLIAPFAWLQPAIIAATMLIGTLVLHIAPRMEDTKAPALIPRTWALACLTAFFVLLIGLPVAASIWPGAGILALFEGFYRTGSLVFGGGHVVLPLLDAVTVQTGLVEENTFLAGYGAAQAVPGPLFSFAAYLGAVLDSTVSGWQGAVICLVAIYVPSFLLVFGLLPFWHQLKSAPRATAALAGANAGVVGLLAAALYDPVFTSAVGTPVEMALAIAAFVALMTLRLPAWLLVIGAATAGGLIL